MLTISDLPSCSTKQTLELHRRKSLIFLPFAKYMSAFSAKKINEYLQLLNLYMGTYKYGAIKRCQPLVWGNMTHDDASVETGVGGQAKYDVMMVFCGNALQKHHKTLKTSTRRYSDCHILHILNRYNK